MAKDAQPKTPITCARCDAALHGGAQCRLCGQWHIGEAAKSTASIIEGTVLLKDVKSAELTRLDAGPFNYIWSGFPDKGLIRTSVTLLGGSPGAGKTTMLLQLAALWAKVTKLEVGFLSAEMTNEELKLYADRLKLKHMDRIRLIPAITGTVNVGEVFAACPFGAVIIDSLQGLVGEDDAMSIEVCKICKTNAARMNTPMMIISQINKEGDYAGVMKLQHAVDTLMLFDVDEETGIRSIEVKKNRFGRANIFSEFEMTDHGLIPYLDEGDDDDDD